VTNYLIDPSIEQGFAFDPNSELVQFQWGAGGKTNDYYFGSSTHVSVVDGTNAVQIYSPARTRKRNFSGSAGVTGEVYTANCWFLTPFDDSIGGNNACLSRGAVSHGATTCCASASA